MTAFAPPRSPLPPARSAPPNPSVRVVPRHSLRVLQTARTQIVRSPRQTHNAQRRMHMKRNLISLTLIALALIVSIPAQAQLKISDSETSKLFITLDTVGTAQ